MLVNENKSCDRTFERKIEAVEEVSDLISCKQDTSSDKG